MVAVVEAGRGRAVAARPLRRSTAPGPRRPLPPAVGRVRPRIEQVAGSGLRSRPRGRGGCDSGAHCDDACEGDDGATKAAVGLHSRPPAESSASYSLRDRLMLSPQLRRYLTLIALSGPRSGLEPDPRSRVGGLKLPGEKRESRPLADAAGRDRRRQAITLAPSGRATPTARDESRAALGSWPERSRTRVIQIAGTRARARSRSVGTPVLAQIRTVSEGADVVPADACVRRKQRGALAEAVALFTGKRGRLACRGDTGRQSGRCAEDGLANGAGMASGTASRSAPTATRIAAVP
jgi:hypothetical protein